MKLFKYFVFVSFFLTYSAGFASHSVVLSSAEMQLMLPDILTEVAKLPAAQLRQKIGELRPAQISSAYETLTTILSSYRSKAPGKKESATKTSSSSSLPLPPTPTGATKAAAAAAAPTTVPAPAAVPAVKVGLDLPTIETVKNTAAGIADNLQQRKYLIETLDKYVKTFDDLAHEENLTGEKIADLKSIFDKIAAFYLWKRNTLTLEDRRNPGAWWDELVKVHRRLGVSPFDRSAAREAAKLFLQLEEYPINEYTQVDKESAGKLNLMQSLGEKAVENEAREMKKRMALSSDKVQVYKSFIQDVRAKMNAALSAISTTNALLNKVKALSKFLSSRGESVEADFSTIAQEYYENPTAVQKDDIISKVTAELDHLDDLSGVETQRTGGSFPEAWQ